jgi:hypothetical protein
MANSDRIVSGLASSAIWAEMNTVARLMISVAGSRDNWRNLIELMAKLAQSRGYSGISDAVSSIDRIMHDSRLVDQVVEVIARASLSNAPHRGDSTSAEFEELLAPLRAAVLALRPLADLTTTRSNARLALLKAVANAIAVPLTLDPLVDAVRGGAATPAEIRSVTECVVAPLQRALDEVKAAVDESSGFGALDAAVGDAGSALEGFSTSVEGVPRDFGAWRGRRDG